MTAEITVVATVGVLSNRQWDAVRAQMPSIRGPLYVSTLNQRPTVTRLLPIEPAEDTEGVPGRQFIFEPNADAVLRQLLPRYVATRIFQAVLELTASEQSAKMVAMRNATENAQELIEDLTLTYNKVRQTNITREMIEIATGATAS